MDIDDLAKAAREQGWVLGKTSKGHHRWVPPDRTKKIVIGSGTPSDYRSNKNFLGQLRRSGFVYPWPPTK